MIIWGAEADWTVGIKPYGLFWVRPYLAIGIQSKIPVS